MSATRLWDERRVVLYAVLGGYVQFISPSYKFIINQVVNIVNTSDTETYLDILYSLEKDNKVKLTDIQILETEYARMIYMGKMGKSNTVKKFNSLLQDYQLIKSALRPEPNFMLSFGLIVLDQDNIRKELSEYLNAFRTDKISTRPKLLPYKKQVGIVLDMFKEGERKRISKRTHGDIKGFRMHETALSLSEEGKTSIPSITLLGVNVDDRRLIQTQPSKVDEIPIIKKPLTHRATLTLRERNLYVIVDGDFYLVKNFHSFNTDNYSACFKLLKYDGRPISKEDLNLKKGRTKLGDLPVSMGFTGVYSRFIKFDSSTNPPTLTLYKTRNIADDKLSEIKAASNKLNKKIAETN